MAGVADVAEALARSQPTALLECAASPDYSDVLERIATALNRIADAQESRKPRTRPMGFHTP